MRLFVGLFPPACALADLNDALAAVRTSNGALRWQPPERWHVTLAFLGEVDRARVAHIGTAVAAVQTSTPTLRLAGSGSFRTGRRAGVLWIGVEGDGLARLAGQVGSAVPAREPRMFRPHVTIARWRPPDQPDRDTLASLEGYRGPAWTPAEVTLMRSHLGAQPRYERVDGWPLRD